MIAPRSLLGAAKQPPYRIWCTRGGGTHAANFSNSSSAPTHANQLYAQAVAAMTVNDPSCLAPGRTWLEAIESALRQAISALQDRLGPDMHTWAWGQMHHTRPQHPLSRVFPELATLLDPPAIATGGDGDTPQQGGYSAVDRFVQTLMSVNRYIHDPSDWHRSR